MRPLHICGECRLHPFYPLCSPLMGHLGELSHLLLNGPPTLVLSGPVAFGPLVLEGFSPQFRAPNADLGLGGGHGLSPKVVDW